jgi:flavorubredoxin
VNRSCWMEAIDWKRRFYDSLIPLQAGTTYNAYLIEGSENAVPLDTDNPTMANDVMVQLYGVKKLDYIVSRHAEQDAQ